MQRIFFALYLSWVYYCVIRTFFYLATCNTKTSQGTNKLETRANEYDRYFPIHPFPQIPQQSLFPIKGNNSFFLHLFLESQSGNPRWDEKTRVKRKRFSACMLSWLFSFVLPPLSGFNIIHSCRAYLIRHYNEL